MPEKDGYKTLDIIIAELGVPENSVKKAITALDIQTRTFPTDRRHRYYSSADVQKIKEWLESH